MEAHLYSIGNIFVIEDKNALLSTSEDKSVRMVEFPTSYPAQMLRKELTNLNHNIIKNKVESFNERKEYNQYNDKEEEEDDYIGGENNYSNFGNSNNYTKKERYKNNMGENDKFFTIMITEPLNKSYQNIFSDDLDGWDDEIVEF